LWVEGKLAVRDETNAVSVQNAISQIILSDAAWQKLAAYAKETGDESRIRSIAVWNIGRHEILKGRGGSLRAAIEAGGGASDIRLLLRSESFDSFGRESGGLMFIGSFLAAAFLIAAASTIAFKQMEDAEDDKGRYLLLSEIGMSAKDAKRAVSFQVFSGFFLPLCMGVIHTLFALRMLHTVTGFFVGLPALGVAGAQFSFSSVRLSWSRTATGYSCRTSLRFLCYSALRNAGRGGLREKTAGPLAWNRREEGKLKRLTERHHKMHENDSGTLPTLVSFAHQVAGPEFDGELHVLFLAEKRVVA
jgi:hypothetical protein